MTERRSKSGRLRHLPNNTLKVMKLSEILISGRTTVSITNIQSTREYALLFNSKHVNILVTGMTY